MPRFFHCGPHRLALERPLVMGIVNVTPDSFSDGGRFLAADQAIAHARQLIDEGADLLDIGGESTRPGAATVPVEEECARVLPVITALRDGPVPISIDTRKPAVMQAAIEAGATLVNDIAALEAPGALELVARVGVGVCLMHKQGEPATMQQAPAYGSVVEEVEAYLLARAQAAERAGVKRASILIDPGFGFGKTFAHNQALFRALPRLVAQGYPVLVGVSRKTMLGQLIAAADGTLPPPVARDTASVAAAILAAEAGTAVLRVHAVRETVEALRIWQGLRPWRDTNESISEARI